MNHRWSAAGYLLLVSAMTVSIVTGCDPGSDLTLQIRNGTQRTIRVTVPVLVSMWQAPPQESPGIDVTIGPGKVVEERLGMAMGSRAEIVRAYAGERLVFCERYTFAMSSYRGNYSVEIVDGHMGVGCEDQGAVK